MKIELIIIAVTAFFIYNTYHDGKYTKMILEHKKYYTIAFYGFLGLSFIVLMKRSPHNTKDLVNSATNLLKFLPVDKHTTKFIKPVLNLSKTNIPQYSQPIQYSQPMQYSQPNSNNLVSTSDISYKDTIKKTHKRSVGESKKKFVAAQQSWKCNNCNDLLNASYEVDHIMPLYKGGDNSISNLVALCRNCHGIKTMKDNLLT
jgi:5-methylcytosine-specific restriction endonuclease McrA